MSASPSGLSNGQTPTPKAAGAPPGFVKRRKPGDPLRARKPVRKPVTMQQQSNMPPNASANGSSANGIRPGQPVKHQMQNGPNGFQSKHANTNISHIPIKQEELRPPPRQLNFTHPPRGRVEIVPLYTTKRALREGLRYHVAKFMSKKPVDPYNQEEFTRPAVLHRRDPRAPAPGKPIQEGDIEPEEVMDSKEREKQEILRAEKERQRAEDLAQIAPSGNNAAAMSKKKNKPFRNEKTTQVHRLDKSEADKKASDLRYEEALPWFLEDADNQNTWVGSYEAALSSVNAMLVYDGGAFRMVPIEKWYRFTQKPQFKTFTIEEAEAQLSKKHKESRWVMKTDEQKQAEQNAADYKRMRGVSSYVKQESSTFKAAGRGEKNDIDDLDYDDLFDNDDEQPGLEPERDEVHLEAQARIKKEQYSSNVFGEGLFRDEHDVDKELQDIQREAEMTKKFGKSTKKALRKRERNLAYQSDSEDHPYSSSSDDDTSDEEKQAEIDKRKDEEAKAKLKAEAAKLESKLPSGASSKGTNTPSGRPKHSDPLKKVNKLKRPGSPNLSESSGNESTRKKMKKSSNKTGTSTPIDARGSPAPTSQPGISRTSSVVKLTVNPSRLSEMNPTSPNAGSDGEATGGEMSDGGRKKKLKLRLGGSPTGSRAGSPAPGRAGSNVGSRAASPQLREQARSPSSQGPITAAEIRAALPATGISVGDMLKGFKSRLGEAADGKISRPDFILLVKQNSRLSEKLLYPK